MDAKGTSEETKVVDGTSSDPEIKCPFPFSGASGASSKHLISDIVDCLHQSLNCSHSSNNSNNNRMGHIYVILLAVPLGLVLLTSLESLFVEPQHQHKMMLISALPFPKDPSAGGIDDDQDPFRNRAGFDQLSGAGKVGANSAVAPSLDRQLPSLAAVDGPELRQTKPDVVIVKTDVQRPRVLLISAIQQRCSSVMGEDVVLLGLKNKVDYARLHGIDIDHSSVDVPLEPPEERKWHKIAIIQEKMDAFPDYDWYVWVEYDTIFTDMAFEIPWQSYAAYSLVLWGIPGPLYTADKLAVNVVSTNTMYIRNNQVSKKLLDRLMEVCKNGYKDVDAILSDKPGKWSVNDQFAMLYLLSREQALWKQHVFLENNYHISRYWADENDRLEEYFTDWRGEGQFPPFMMSFVGCGFCVDAPLRPEQCVNRFHRAFRFANNQLLSVFNMTHKNLDTEEVVRLTASAS